MALGHLPATLHYPALNPYPDHPPVPPFLHAFYAILYFSGISISKIKSEQNSDELEEFRETSQNMYSQNDCLPYSFLLYFTRIDLSICKPN